MDESGHVSSVPAPEAFLGQNPQILTLEERPKQGRSRTAAGFSGSRPCMWSLGAFKRGAKSCSDWRAVTALQLLGTEIQKGCPWASFPQDSNE